MTPGGTVYLLHFSVSYRHAAHYLGWTPGPLEDRLRIHQCGQGARLVEVVCNAGITFELARVWPGGTRTQERARKNAGGLGQYCPLCKAAGIHQRHRMRQNAGRRP